MVTAIGPAQGYDFTYGQTYSTVDEANALPHLFMNETGFGFQEHRWARSGSSTPSEARLMLEANPDSQGDGLDGATATLDRVLETIVFIDFEG